MKKVMFGAGCFWGVEEAFRTLGGVWETQVGYSGGGSDAPTYKQVCTGNTGHAEVVLVNYDPQKVKFNELLELFFSCHNPTTLNRQGPDIGSQYRSCIFFYDDQQKTEVQFFIEKLEKSQKFSSPVVTEVSQAGAFYRAEEYHQKYILKGGKASCSLF